VWPYDVFASFLIFVAEVTSKAVPRVHLFRRPMLSSAWLKEPFRSWFDAIWAQSHRQWSFAGFLALLDSVQSGSHAAGITQIHADNWALWRAASERLLSDASDGYHLQLEAIAARATREEFWKSEREYQARLEAADTCAKDLRRALDEANDRNAELMRQNAELEQQSAEMNSRRAEMEFRAVAAERVHAAANVGLIEAQRQLDEKQQQILDLQQQLGMVQETVAEAQQTLLKWNETVHEQKQEYFLLKETLAQTSEDLTRTNNELARTTDALARTTDELSDRSAELSALHHSVSWRVTGPVRSVSTFFRRLGGTSK
jgi:hypothetical protein